VLQVEVADGAVLFQSTCNHQHALVIETTQLQVGTATITTITTVTLVLPTMTAAAAAMAALPASHHLALALYNVVVGDTPCQAQLHLFAYPRVSHIQMEQLCSTLATCNALQEVVRVACDVVAGQVERRERGVAAERLAWREGAFHQHAHSLARDLLVVSQVQGVHARVVAEQSNDVLNAVISQVVTAQVE
jgi:hypothetical protein